MTMTKPTNITVTSTDIIVLVDALQAIQTLEDMNTSYRHMPSINLIIVDEITGEVKGELKMRYRLEPVDTDGEMIPVGRAIPKKVAKPTK